MKSDITRLSDYAALKKLASALWQQDNSFNGAAVMVGAGFSRVAATTGNAKNKLPLWNELSKLLADEIGSSSQMDPLRLAEEYRAYFGQQALLDLLKKALHDEAWMPGDLHKDLLTLPWSEVLTTNWDTLLERISVDIPHPIYGIVNRQEDLASARAPRIVKLHGTMGVTDELIFTQEDYRKYPQQHAAFVNFARQVFIENELCLLGFSGDDPNFLQWAGWVRDHLANNARRIYLVGALELTAAKRKYLESINVAPIDLNPLVADYDDPDARHTAATKIFLEALQKLKPKPVWEWTPTKLHRTTFTNDEINKTHQDSAYAAKLSEGQIATLESDRLAYPGWLTCPPSLFFSLQSQINDPFPTTKNLAAMIPESRAKLLYEIAWRCDVTYQASQSWLVQELLVICDPDKPCALSKRQQLEVALLLLKSSRWLNEPEAQSITQITTAILEENTKHWPESANELAYHRAIIARDRFDYPGIENAIEILDTSDSVWKLKKASLLAELGRFDEGKNLVADAYRELLNQNRKDRNSIHTLSRLAWAHWLMHGIDLWTPGKEFKAFPSIYQDLKCSPWGQIEHIQDRIVKTLEKQRGKQCIEPSFEPGCYKDNSKTVTISNELHPLLLLDGISRTVGMPLRWEHVSFLVEPAAKLTELDGLDDAERFALAIRAANSETAEVLKKVFSRVQVACFSSESVVWLLNRCKEAIDYWSTKLSGGSEDVRRNAIDRLRVFIEVYARISVRVTPEQAKEILKKGLELGKLPAFQHPWLIDTLRNLIENAIKSISQAHQHELLIEGLFFPLQAETNVGAHLDWPNPIIQFPGNRGASTALNRRIDEIIDRIAPCSLKSAPALLRLLPLLDADFLTEAERKKIGEKIWGSMPDYQALPETGLLPHVFFKLPAPDSVAARNAVRRHLFEAREDHLFNQFLLLSIANAAQTKKNSELPSTEQATAYFEKLVYWRSKADSKDPFWFANQHEEQLNDSIGKALAYSIVPSLPAEALNQENFNKLLAFYSEVDAPATIVALSHFAAVNELFAKQVEKLVRQGFQAQEANKVAFSAFALLKWREIKASPATDRLTSRLVYLLGLNLSGGLTALLWTAGQMYVKGYLSEDDAESLADAVPAVFDSADYKNIAPFSREAVSISLVRVKCVRLAKAILDKRQDNNSELLRVLEEAKHDALPEVRFAETMDD